MLAERPVPVELEPLQPVAILEAVNPMPVVLNPTQPVAVKADKAVFVVLKARQLLATAPNKPTPLTL